MMDVVKNMLAINGYFNLEGLQTYKLNFLVSI
jgi:hypothetical protein